MSPNFGNRDHTLISGYDGKKYKLYKSTWDLKLTHEERAHVEFNYHKIVETLLAPEAVRVSMQDDNCFIAYKEFDAYWVRPNVSAPSPPGIRIFAVVCDGKKCIIKTFYPTKKMKEGKNLWPQQTKTK